MLKFELVQTTKILTNRFATTEKSPIYLSHKSYKKPLANIKKEKDEKINFIDSIIYYNFLFDR